MMKHVVAVLVSVMPLVIGCSFVRYDVEQVDYKTTQSKAGIIIGDPQVYARASLINDRRREAEYLQQLLQNSTSVTFTPQLIRDLKTVEALSLSLGLTFGKSIPTDTALSSLTQQIDATKLQSQLAILQKQVEGIQAAQPPKVDIPPLDLSKSTDPTTSGSTPAAASSVVMPDVTALQAQLKSIQDQLRALTAPGAATAPSNAYSGLMDPRNDFADRQAYRRDIRAALSEAQLDDAHDVGGNALYRLQFQATVLPLSNTSRQWGATVVSLSPPQLTPGDIASAYSQWLAYISRELTRKESGGGSSAADSNAHNFDYDRYIVELGRQGYFDVIDLFSDDVTGQFYCLAHRTAQDEQLEQIQSRFSYGPSGFLRGKALIGTYAVPPALVSVSEDCRAYPAEDRAPDPETRRQAFLAVFQSPISRPIIGPLISWINLSSSFGAFDAGGRTASSSEPEFQNAKDYVPPLFCEAIVDPAEKGNCDNPPPLRPNAVAAAPTQPSKFSSTARFTAAGGTTSVRDGLDSARQYAIRSYSVLPSELAQRLGVTTEASQSLQTALAVGAQLSAAAKGSLDTGFLSQSDARAQALARQPMVVGFAGNEFFEAGTANADADEIGAGFFGWLFGPSFKIQDSKTLILRQDVRTYGVNADVSFPGWWTYASLNISSAWISNWNAAQIMARGASDPVATVHKRVTLPVSGATYESLTNFIAARQYGPQFSSIFVGEVTPTAVPACASNVTFQIGGANIWRTDSVFLGGVRAKTVTVLPNMKGVAAEFDMNTVYGNLINSDNVIQSVPLTVSAAQGIGTAKTIYFLGKRQTVNGVTTCQSPLLVPTNWDMMMPTIMSYAPTEICLHTKYVPLLIQGIGMYEDAVVRAEHFDGSVTNTDLASSRRLIALTLKRGAELRLGAERIALDSSEFGTIGSVELTVKDCSKKPAEDAQQSQKKVSLVTESVKLAKDQVIEVKAPVPEGYTLLTVAVRPQTKPADSKSQASKVAVEPVWISSAPVTSAQPGNASNVKATLDLSGLKAAVGDKLDVRVEVTLRPGTIPQTFPADKPAAVSH